MVSKNLFFHLDQTAVFSRRGHCASAQRTTNRATIGSLTALSRWQFGRRLGARNSLSWRPPKRLKDGSERLTDSVRHVRGSLVDAISITNYRALFASMLGPFCMPVARQALNGLMLLVACGHPTCLVPLCNPRPRCWRSNFPRPGRSRRRRGDSYCRYVPVRGLAANTVSRSRF